MIKYDITLSKIKFLECNIQKGSVEKHPIIWQCISKYIQRCSAWYWNELNLQLECIHNDNYMSLTHIRLKKNWCPVISQELYSTKQHFKCLYWATYVFTFITNAVYWSLLMILKYMYTSKQSSENYDTYPFSLLIMVYN